MTMVARVTERPVPAAPHDDFSSAPWGTYEPTLRQYAWIQVIRHLPPWLRKPVQRRFERHEQHALCLPLDIAVSGIRYRCIVNDNGPEAKLAFKGRRADYWQLTQLRSHLRNARTFVDVGANCGFYTLNAAKLMSPQSRIVAIEPNPLLVQRLRTNISLNAVNNVDVVEAAVGPESGWAFRTSGPGDHGEAQYAQDEAVEEQGEPAVMRSLLEIVTSLELDGIDVLKIDIEGFEDRALLPFFHHASPDLWPKVIAIEHKNRQHWSIDVINQLIGLAYTLHAEDQCDTILKRGLPHPPTD